MVHGRLRLLSRLLLVGAVAIIVGGLVYDGSREAEDPNLAPLYVVGIVLGLLAVVLAQRTHRRHDS